MNTPDHPVIAQWARAARRVATVHLIHPGARGNPPVFRLQRIEGVAQLAPGKSVHVRPDRIFWRLNDELQSRAFADMVRRSHCLGVAPDVLHGHFAAASRSLVAGGRKVGVPSVISEHSTALTGLNALRPMTRVRLEATRRAFEAATLVAPVSQFLANRLREQGFEVPMRVVPNPVDTEVFRPGGSADSYRLIAAGRLDPVKRLDLTIRALALLRRDVPEATLVVAGDGPDRARLEALCSDLELQEAVTFLGRLAPSGLAAAMQQSAVLVSTSEVETFGVAAAEALACGCRVMATPSSAITELAPAPHVLSPSDGSARSFADALRQLLNTDAGDRWGRYQFVSQRYSLGAVSAQLADVYRAVCR